MRNHLIITLILGFTLTNISFAQMPLTYQENMTKAGEFFETEDWAALNTHLDAAQAIRPYSLYVWKNRVLILMGRCASFEPSPSVVYPWIYPVTRRWKRSPPSRNSRQSPPE